MKNTNNKVVAFLRVASHKPVHEYNSLHHQLDRIEKYASQHNQEITAVFENSNKSELEDDLGEMLWYCEENPAVNQVLVTSFDRISRSLEEIQDWVASFEEIGVDFKLVPQQTDFSANKVLERMIAIASTMENSTRGTVVKERMRRKAEAGYLMYAPPIGYERTDINGIYRPNKFGLLFGMVISNAAILGNQIELKNLLFQIYEEQVGRKPTKIELRRWISNPYYVGLVKYEGKTYQGLHVALFSRAVQKQLIKALS